MKVRSMRIPEDIEQAIEYVSRVEKVEMAQSLRKLARVGFESYVAKAYKEGRVTLNGVYKGSPTKTIFHDKYGMLMI